LPAGSDRHHASRLRQGCDLSQDLYVVPPLTLQKAHPVPIIGRTGSSFFLLCEILMRHSR
jgi:hypothetical protein